MEKIETPIQSEIRKQQTILSELQSENKLKKIRSRSWQIGKSKIVRQEFLIGILESLLPAECDLIEKVWSDGVQFMTIDTRPRKTLANNYLRYTFKIDPQMIND